MPEKSQLRLKIIWKDDMLLELRASASNGRYCGTTEVYTTSEDLIDFANRIEGFPRQITDIVECEIGKRDSYAYLGLKFYCIDGSGHVAVQVYMEENVPTVYRPEEKHKVVLEIKYEAAAIDRFQKELMSIAARREGSACLC